MTDLTSPINITLSGDLTVGNASVIQKQLMESLAAGSAVEILLKNVTAVDTSFMQLICAAHKSAANRRIPISIRIDSSAERVHEVRKKGGFARNLNCFADLDLPCPWIKGK